MKQVFGCVNENCSNYDKKIRYKNEDVFCSKCGQSLVTVCKKCQMPLPEDMEDIYCIRCQAERDDAAHKRNKVLSVAGVVVAGIFAAVGKVVAENNIRK